MDSDLVKVIQTLKKIVELLVQKKYRELEQLSGGFRLTAAEMDQAISDYDEVLVLPPDSDYKNVDAIEVTGSQPRSWSIRYDLWTEEEGRSDLSLEATFIENDQEIMGVEIDNIHVL
ncbi:hypothetical protein BFW38_02365 [Terasakiispira papahanaumokuakeensis]|uniref:DUF7668 domain-containing protein n=1 Tax=Terasakiispira papahanaumokuakeensis TaxID=197479 RepID=A0A1E2V6B8_9GAMM|nr:hypothetical protein [Terasakiispira papahanaumokuakeensis]ODC02560.1 hypothetical protein BFW38_02365 [Terasakiispira papahanaumokuakeensis]